MKTKQKILTGVLIGMGLIIVPLILMGTKISSIDESGRYQISTTTSSNTEYIYETIIDTKTGRVKSREAKSITWY